MRGIGSSRIDAGHHGTVVDVVFRKQPFVLLAQVAVLRHGQPSPTVVQAEHIVGAGHTLPDDSALLVVFVVIAVQSQGMGRAASADCHLGIHNGWNHEPLPAVFVVDIVCDPPIRIGNVLLFGDELSFGVYVLYRGTIIGVVRCSVIISELDDQPIGRIKSFYDQDGIIFYRIRFDVVRHRIQTIRIIRMIAGRTVVCADAPFAQNKIQRGIVISLLGVDTIRSHVCEFGSIISILLADRIGPLGSRGILHGIRKIGFRIAASH